MANARVVICCWLKGHQTELAMTKKQEEKLSVKLKTLKAICPMCRNEGLGNQPAFIKEGQTLFNPSKIFKCRHGHVSTVGAFNNDMLHVNHGVLHEDFFNIEGTPEEVQELIDSKDISCHHVRENGRVCDCKLKAVDDFDITKPQGTNFRTKQRLGDLMDKAGLEPVRSGSYDRDGHYRSTRTEVANRERLKRMRKRNIPKDRHPGKRIDKATKRDYGRRSKSEVNPERLNGPK